MTSAIAGNLSKHVWYLLHDVLGFSTWEICGGSVIVVVLWIVIGSALAERKGNN